jgi:hypothetical protein
MLLFEMFMNPLMLPLALPRHPPKDLVDTRQSFIRYLLLLALLMPLLAAKHAAALRPEGY